VKAVRWKGLGIRDAAAAVCAHLNSKSIEASLVGGACVSIYSDNAYESFDLDFVSHEPHKKIEAALAEIGFVSTGGRHFDHPDCKYYAEFVAPPVSIGEEVIKKLKRLETPYGFLNLLSPTDCVKDRLAANLHWKDTQALEQAVMVALGNRVDMAKVKAWAVKEGSQSTFERFAEALALQRKRAKGKKRDPKAKA
jgi:hypothetical protein